MTAPLCCSVIVPTYNRVERLRHTLDSLVRQDLPRDAYEVLAIINTPVDTEAFGTACPYFEAIASWALRVFTGQAALPDRDTRAEWCRTHMDRLDDRRYYDCWLETIRIGLLAGTLPDPEQRFDDYWRLVAGQVDPAHLRPGHTGSRPAAYDDVLFDLAELKHRVPAALPGRARADLPASGRITAADDADARGVAPGRQIAPWLPYRTRTATTEAAQ